MILCLILVNYVKIVVFFRKVGGGMPVVRNVRTCFCVPVGDMVYPAYDFSNNAKYSDIDGLGVFVDRNIFNRIRFIEKAILLDLKSYLSKVNDEGTVVDMYLEYDTSCLFYFRAVMAMIVCAGKRYRVRIDLSETLIYKYTVKLFQSDCYKENKQVFMANLNSYHSVIATSYNAMMSEFGVSAGDYYMSSMKFGSSKSSVR